LVGLVAALWRYEIENFAAFLATPFLIFAFFQHGRFAFGALYLWH
jgi:hypothetical protein